MGSIQVSSSRTTTVPPHRRFVPIPRSAPESPTDDRPDGSETASRHLYRDEPETCRRDPRQFALILGYLGLLVAVIWQYRIEGQAFLTITTMALVGLPIHYLLPYARKKRFFLALSIGGMLAVFGLQTGVLVAAASAVLIGLCYLPAPWTVRAGAIAAVGIGLGIARSSTDWLPGTFWPVLGSMFIFRMIIYLYELKHAKGNEKLTDTIGYFFMLPNYCFPHFPVVDYRTWQRGYFADDVHDTMRRGLDMIFRGVVQLLLYRLIYNELLIEMSAVQDPLTLLQYLACNYLLYLHVSGQFHTACGIMHLYGFKLPETHHYFLMASGFTDYWRRINIYWKDFMVRVIFNPIVFRLKKRPQWQSLSIATVVVFVATWFLHAYQMYWLHGSWNFSVPDALFWGVLGFLVLINVHLDMRASRRRRRPSKQESAVQLWRRRLIHAAKVGGTLTTIVLLWALWNSPSVEAWLAMLGRGTGLIGPELTALG